MVGVWRLHLLRYAHFSPHPLHSLVQLKVHLSDIAAGSSSLDHPVLTTYAALERFFILLLTVLSALSLARVAVWLAARHHHQLGPLWRFCQKDLSRLDRPRIRSWGSHSHFFWVQPAGAGQAYGVSPQMISLGAPCSNRDPLRTNITYRGDAYICRLHRTLQNVGN